MTYSMNVKMKEICYTEMLPEFQRTTRAYNQTIKFYITTAAKTSNPVGSLKVYRRFFINCKVKFYPVS
jgi:hypothetical protein